MARISVRYVVDDVPAAIGFYRDLLGFHLDMNPAPGFAALSMGGFRLYLNVPGVGGGGQSVGGKTPGPGGWNRFQIEVDDLEQSVALLIKAGCRFRGDMISGVGGKQILAEDPSGNPVELFQPASRA